MWKRYKKERKDLTISPLAEVKSGELEAFRKWKLEQFLKGKDQSSKSPKVGPKVFTCRNCHKFYMEKKDLLTHLSKCAERPAKYLCRKGCGFKSKTLLSIKEHEKNHVSQLNTAVLEPTTSSVTLNTEFEKEVGPIDDLDLDYEEDTSEDSRMFESPPNPPPNPQDLRSKLVKKDNDVKVTSTYETMTFLEDATSRKKLLQFASENDIVRISKSTTTSLNGVRETKTITLAETPF